MTFVGWMTLVLAVATIVTVAAHTWDWRQRRAGDEQRDLRDAERHTEIERQFAIVEKEFGDMDRALLQVIDRLDALERRMETRS